MQKNGSADVKVQLKYPDIKSQMPNKIIYTYTSGGIKRTERFDNPNPCK